MHKFSIVHDNIEHSVVYTVYRPVELRSRSSVANVLTHKKLANNINLWLASWVTVKNGLASFLSCLSNCNQGESSERGNVQYRYRVSVSPALSIASTDGIVLSLFFGWCEAWYIWNKQKQQSKCYTWTEAGPKNVPRQNRSNVGPERSRTRTWTCTNVRYLGNGAKIRGELLSLANRSRRWAFHWYQNYHPRRPISGCGAKGRESVRLVIKRSWVRPWAGHAA